MQSQPAASPRYGPRRETRARISSAIAALALFGLIGASPAAARIGRKAPFADGDRVTITGRVADRAGQPLADLEVVLEAARRRFDLIEMGTERKHVVRQATTTDERGEYSLDWTWDGYYDDFRVQAEVPVRVAGGAEKREVLARLDIGQRLLAGSPVPAPLVVEDTRFLATFREFLASLTTEDLRRAYETLGKPDSVETFVDPRYNEVTWWYFGGGQALRFRDGQLVETSEFAPVRPL